MAGNVQSTQKKPHEGRGLGRWVILLSLVVSSSLRAQPAPFDVTPSQVDAPTPTVRLADVDAAYMPNVAPEGDAQPPVGPGPVLVEVPVYGSNPSDVSGLVLTVDYDQIFLRFEAFRQVSDAWIPGQQFRSQGNGTGGRVGITFTRYSGRGDAEENGEILLGFVQFALNDLDPAVQTPSPRAIDVRLETADSSSYYYRTGPDGSEEQLDTDLTDGTISLFFEDRVDLASGVISPVAQKIAVPLYLTVLRPTSSPAQFTVDYDQIFLRFDGARPTVPGIFLGDEIKVVRPENEGADDGPTFTTLTFTLNTEEIEGPLLRRHVADLNFTYTGKDPGEDHLSVSVQLVSTNSPVEPQDKGTRERIVAHIQIGSPYFVRGNVTSRYDVLSDGTLEVGMPQLVDVTLIFQYLMAGGTLDCKVAADTDGNGELNVTDAILLLQYLFYGGLAPVDPFPEAASLAAYETPYGCDKSLPHFYLKQ